MDNTIDYKELYDEWINIANIDYETSKRMYDEHWQKQHYIICYLCQQAAEKYLKGFLAYNGEEVIKIHILENLLDVCNKYEQNFETLREKCEYLTPFAVQIRYPDSFYDITDVESSKALEYAKIIIDFVNDKMKDS